MSTSKLVPNDPRVQHRTVILNGQTYGYLYSPCPSTIPFRGTILLFHGFPDISFGWRNQIPFLTSLGLTVIAPDCLGYGRSSAPPTSSLKLYTYKRLADDMATLCAHLGLSQVYLGGHDWGGMCVYRIAAYHPNLVKAVFSICTPYFPPTPVYEPLKLRVATKLPNFGYQLHFASGECEDQIRSKAEIKQFLNALFGGKGPNGETGFDTNTGVKLANLPLLARTSLLSEEELDHYASEYARSGINGPLNWYRTNELNYLDELEHFFPPANPNNTTPNGPKATDPFLTSCPLLFVLATQDQALKPFMAARMVPERIPRLTRREVEAGHWVLWQKPEEVRAILGEWFAKIWEEEEREAGKGKSRL